MKIYYWAPFLSNIATIDSVINSIRSIQKYDIEKKIDPFIVNVTGEWTEKKEKLRNINIINLFHKPYFKNLPKGGIIYSRISQILIFIFNFIKLKNLLKQNKPDYFVAHLIISLPLLLFFLFSFETKLILRISGTPKLNFLRKFFWSKFSKKVYFITCPTLSSYNTLKNLGIFPVNKLKLLYDPIISINQISKNKNKEIDNFLKNKEYILSIGRLTKQKNFTLLIKSFNEIKKKLPDIKLVILGEGEERTKLENLVSSFKLSSSVFMPGYKSNVFNFLNNSKCFISSSLYEDPGFSLIEAGSINKIVIAPDTKTGPSEILDESNRGFLFKKNDLSSLVEKFFEFYYSNEKLLNLKKIKMKKYTKNFTLFSHYQEFIKIIICSNNIKKDQ